jgi:hypothetical protein
VEHPANADEVPIHLEWRDEKLIIRCGRECLGIVEPSRGAPEYLVAEVGPGTGGSRILVVDERNGLEEIIRGTATWIAKAIMNAWKSQK